MKTLKGWRGGCGSGTSHRSRPWWFDPNLLLLWKLLAAGGRGAAGAFRCWTETRVRGELSVCRPVCIHDVRRVTDGGNLLKTRPAVWTSIIRGGACPRLVPPSRIFKTLSDATGQRFWILQKCGRASKTSSPTKPQSLWWWRAGPSASSTGSSSCSSSPTSSGECGPTCGGWGVRWGSLLQTLVMQNFCCFEDVNVFVFLWGSGWTQRGNSQESPSNPINLYL